MATKEFQDNILILSDSLISHLQRIEKLVANELSCLYDYQKYFKNECSDFYKFSEKDTEEGEIYFKSLNNARNKYRSNLERIKNLEDTQRKIRHIIRNQ